MPDRRPTSPTSHPVIALRILPLALALLAGSGASPASVDGLAEPADTARAIGGRSGWIVSLAEPCRDTLAAPAADVIDAAERCLEADDWRVQSRDRSQGDLVTGWKEFHHPLARLLLGRVDARCAVAIRSLDDERTLVVFQGALASRERLDGNPAFTLAMHKYRDAARDWQREVRGDLSIRRVLRADAR
ncbi:MAG TPA: hypothetical protein VF363_07045 [Candidatus Eisenbacteria bacterium]